MAEQTGELFETGCCPRFNPEPWDGKEIDLRDRLFVRAKVRTVFHIPFGFGRVIMKNMEKVIAANALSPESLLLYRNTSLFSAEVYIAVAGRVPGAKTERLSGTFLTKVFEGPYRDAGKWAKETKAYAKEKGKKPGKLYLYYTTCPRCARKYGQNYVVVFAAV